MSRAARANHKCPIIMEFENGSLQEFVGQEPNISVYLAPYCPFTTKETPRAKPLSMFKLLSLNYSKS